MRAGLSIVEVAARTGISVRDIAAAERGEHLYAPRELQALSEVYGIPLSKLLNTTAQPKKSPRSALVALSSTVFVTLAVVFFAQSHLREYIAAVPAIAQASMSRTRGSAAVQSAPAPNVSGASDRLHRSLMGLAVAGQVAEMPAMGGQVETMPVDTADTAPLAAIASKRGALGAPYGCPVQPPTGQVVMTQGYNVGTHAPAGVWGAVDLAVDGDGNGYADPSATVGAPVVALHAGIARVVPNNWLAGNYVRLTDELNGWATAYAHLKKLNITNGQRIEPGMVIGWVGTTGYSSGPHLHYEVYHNEINVNPLTVLECW